MHERAVGTDTQDIASKNLLNRTTAPVIRSHADNAFDLPTGPPPEVLEEIEAAWERSQALFEEGFELRFEVDRSTGRVFAEGGCAGEATVHFSACEALALACGETVDELLGGTAAARLAA
jgi:hypothetical protein